MLCSVCHLLNGTDNNVASAEPSLPRKKKYPGNMARDHLLYDKDEGESSDSLDIGSQLASQDQDSRARIPDEGTKSAAKAADESDSRRKEEKEQMAQSYPPSTNPRGNPGTPGPPEDGTVPKTTEYRSQFVAWPRSPGLQESSARKSASMGLIASQVHKKDALDGEVPSAESVADDDDDAALDAVKRGRIKKTEYKAKFRPFSAYTYVDGNWKKATRLIKDNETASEADQNAWYSEVVERLQKADQYRTRSHAGAPLYGSGEPPEFFIRTILSPVSVASSSRDSFDQPKPREGSTKKKHHVEKTTVRPKSAEPVIPVKSPKKTRPRAPKDLPVRGHGDLSRKAHRQSVEKSSPVGMKPRAVARPHPAGPAGDEEGRVWLKPDKGALVNGFEDSESGKMVNGEDHSVQAKMNGQHVPVMKYPAKVPLTTVKSPEEVTGVRSPDPESWTVPLEIGKGLHWMDGKTPDGVQQKAPPMLLSKRLKESSLVGKSQSVICDPGSEAAGESVDL